MNDPAALPERLAKAALSSDLIRRADQIAEAAHAGQFRKDEETPYIDHPRCVAEWFLDYAERRQLSPEDIDQGVCAALLHDVVEDTQTTAADLKQAFPHPRMLELIALLTKSDTTTSAPARYYEQIAGDPSAVVLKTCDRIANLYDAAALPDTLENRAFWRKYARKSEAFVERIVRADTILGGELSRALYVVRT
ncbi:MAG: HD domain-containing protein, partial [Candidatus Eremiobacteraeota bacterium]|nr:HD domain-containing protein [Candidatus Eremiobacteraeota bacterium]